MHNRLRAVFFLTGRRAMKRDMDLVRRILIEVETADSCVSIESMACDKYPLPVVGYHVELMTAHGLIDAKVSRDWGGNVVNGSIKALTWSGCDYLDAIRDEGVWRRTKAAVSEAVGDTTLSTIKETASMVAIQLIKANLGI